MWLPSDPGGYSIVSSQWTPPRCSTYRCHLRLKITKEGPAPGHLSVLLSEMYHDKRKNIQATFFTHLITGWVLRRKLQERKWCLNSIAGRRRQRKKKKIIFMVIHLKMLKSFYNYGSSGAINHRPRQFSDTGSANYMLWDRIALLQLHPIDIFCRDVRVSWNPRSASCYHINMKPPSLGMTPGSGVQYRLSAVQHLAVAETLLPKM